MKSIRTSANVLKVIKIIEPLKLLAFSHWPIEQVTLDILDLKDARKVTEIEVW